MLLLRTSVALLVLVGGWATGCATGAEGPLLPAPAEGAQAKAAFMHANLLHRRGRLEEAAEAYAEAARLDPDSAELQLYLATVWGEQGDRERALGHARRAAEIAPDEPRVVELSAEIHLGAGRTEQGIDLLRSLLDRGEISESAALRLFRAYFEGGQLDGVEDVLLQMIEVAPDDLRPRLLLGSSYEHFGRADRAEAIYRQALESDAGELDLYDRLAQLLEQSGKPEAEIEILGRKLEQAPDDPYALERISALYEQRERREESVRLLERLVASDSADPPHPSRVLAHIRLGQHYFALSVSN